MLEVPFPQAERQWQTFIRAKRPQRMEGVAMMPLILQAQEIAGGDEGPEKLTDPFMAENKLLAEYTRLGDLLRQRNRFQAALIEYQKAEKASPKESPALQVKIARTYMMGGDLESAQDVLQQLIRRYQEFGPAWTTLGQVRVELGDAEGAIEAFEEALASNPYDPTVHAFLAELYQGKGDLEGAARERRAVSILMDA